MYDSHTENGNLRRRAVLLIAFALFVWSLLGVSLSFAEKEDQKADSGKTSEEATWPDASKLKVVCPKATVYCVNTGTFLYDKGMNDKIYPASCTKILTTILAMENADADQKVVVPKEVEEVINPSSSHIALIPGEELKLRDLWYGMLLPSGNDCAVTAAITVAGSLEDFATMMNEKAAEIGCEDSHFVNPHGLHDKNHYTTVHDLALIMAYCVQNETFVEVDSSLKYTIPKTNKTKEPRELWNNHRMVENKYAYYAPVIGGKSGATNEAMYNLVTYGKKDDIELIVVTAGGQTPDEDCEDTRTLMEFFFKNYSLASLAVTTSDLPALTVDEREVPLTMEDTTMTALLPKDYDEESVTKTFTKKDGLTLPIEEGEAVGELEVTAADQLLGTVPVYAAEEVAEPSGLRSSLSRITATSAGAILILVLGISRLATNHRKEKRNRTR